MTTATATATAKPGRKFPPPCWTRDEALVLIEAYRERWYALHRAFLRNPDWDDVAEKVTTTCPDVTPPKTSAQCRHKMEKLRQRHRAEKQRAASFPGGKFFSSWFYFEAMEAMENGPKSEPENNSSNPEINGIPVSDLQLNPGRGIRFKPATVHNLVTLANHSNSPVFDSNSSNNYYNHHNQNSLYMNNWGNQLPDNEPGSGYRIRVKPVITEQAPKFSKVVHDHEEDENGEFWIRVPRKKMAKNGIHEVISSIKLLGDGFMKMEKMKIEMAREIEQLRMETEMKRNRLILESQKQIVDVVLKGLVAIRKQPEIKSMADL